jgi:hypothetical protein
MLGSFNLGLKRLGREADHSPPSSAEVKSGGAVRPLPHMSSYSLFMKQFFQMSIVMSKEYEECWKYFMKDEGNPSAPSSSGRQRKMKEFFSTPGIFVTKEISRLLGRTINALCVLIYHLKNYNF